MVPLNIREFAVQYCSDIIEEAKRRSNMFDLSEFSYDEIITEEDGTRVPVINTTSYQIPIADILGMDRTEFAKPWPYAECLEAYDTYVSNLVILEGEEALTSIRKQMALEQEKMELYAEKKVDFAW